ncbi:hypothetical protein AWE51_01910 [Aquimarina aggregata]|uniref:Thioredoxin domain-containing protein n=1 Tax=Aquimarina aggregata TaxID=1642818 RepID=A0A163CAL0_9FLAO|nr:thioredoxin family protein [Aquimarina aggregata]KZS42222.1 hypothetical protein AWE51_01910 [Aquimarina aggregata]
MNRLAPLLFIFLCLFFTYNSAAQDWKYDLEEAKDLAKEKDQKIVLFFTGSDWCPPCIKLERNVLSSKEFEEFAKQKYVWLKADFPRRRKNKSSISSDQKRKNAALAKQYNKRKLFPAILILNKEGMVLGATGYRNDLDVHGYISLLTSFDAFGE